ncbi:class E sortase [Rubrobacter calidifluminis]|uniref:class E sortase n=1 Tax=Rubrobacter calidifluminis TaxID=1392640 RepID=UPI00235EAB3F|nr:class E sortase [Rubrobacter calidifluminis]
MRLRGFVILLVGVLAFALVAVGCGQSQRSEAGKPKTMNERARQQQVAPKEGEGRDQGLIAPAPESHVLRLTVPAMKRVHDAVVPTAVGTDEQALKNHVAIHLKGTGFPWQKVTNVYIAGHRLGYRGTRSLYAFYDLNKLKKGDRIYITDANGRKYTYEVFKKFAVAPTDVSVTKPVPGKNIVTLQSCTLPDYEKRLIVQGKLVSHT